MHAAGFAICACEATEIPAQELAKVRTGLTLQLPSGTYGRLAPRSGLAVKHGLMVGAGVIDPDYTAEVCVLLFNFGKTAFTINVGVRIAQLILEQCCMTDAQLIDPEGQLVCSRQRTRPRGCKGFGSAGV